MVAPSTRLETEKPFLLHVYCLTGSKISIEVRGSQLRNASLPSARRLAAEGRDLRTNEANIALARHFANGRVEQNFSLISTAFHVLLFAFQNEAVRSRGKCVRLRNAVELRARRNAFEVLIAVCQALGCCSPSANPL